MFAYSARKTAKVMPEYSTWKPATISDSPSATSKGARLVSGHAGDEIDQEQGHQRQPEPVEHAALLRRHDITKRLRLPAATSTTRAKPIAIS